MDDKKNEVDSDKTIDSSAKLPSKHEESNDVPLSKKDVSDKKNLTPDTVCRSEEDGSGDEHGKQPPTESTEEKTSKTTDCGVSNKLETFFSDIESSDDSVGYEPKLQPTATVPEAEKKKTPSPSDEKKFIESEFEPVESDEEFLDDILSQESNKIEGKVEEKEPLIVEEHESSSKQDSEAQNKKISDDIPQETKDESAELKRNEKERSKSPISTSDLIQLDRLSPESLTEFEDPSVGAPDDVSKVEKSEELIEQAPLIEDIESAKSPEIKPISDTTPISPTKMDEDEESTPADIENSKPKESSETVQLDTVETDVEMPEKSNSNAEDDGEQLKESILNESHVSESEKIEEEESMQIDETVIEESVNAEMEAVEDGTAKLELQKEDEQKELEDTTDEPAQEKEELDTEEKLKDNPAEKELEQSQANDEHLSVKIPKIQEEEKGTNKSNMKDDSPKEIEPSCENLEVSKEDSAKSDDIESQEVRLESEKLTQTTSTSQDDQEHIEEIKKSIKTMPEKPPKDNSTAEVETPSATTQKMENESAGKSSEDVLEEKPTESVLQESESNKETENPSELSTDDDAKKQVSPEAIDKSDNKLCGSPEIIEPVETSKEKEVIPKDKTEEILEESSKETEEEANLSALRNDPEKSQEPVIEETEKPSDKKSSQIVEKSSSKDASEPKETEKHPKESSDSEENKSTDKDKESEGQIPDVASEVVIEKADEVGKPTEEPKSATEHPEVIEIDDDDDEPENEKKNQEESSTINDQIKETEEVAKIPESKPTEDTPAPMEVDEEVAAKKSSEAEQNSNKIQESSTKNVEPTTSILEDDDEPLLMIDESHKEDNDTESNCMDNETATSAPTTTDSSSEGSLEVFYDKDCVNYECKRTSKNFYRATGFAMNYFKTNKKRTKAQFICEDCYDRSLGSYEDLCKTLKMKQPLLHGTTFKSQEFVEIIDSSDEEESDTGGDKMKDEDSLPKESIEMLEAELEGVIRKVMNNVDIQNQLSWTKQILEQRLTNLQEDSQFVTEQLRALQKKADNMHNSLYQCPKIKLRQLTPLDLNSGRMYNPESDAAGSIPPPGEIIRNPIVVNEQYYAVKTKAIASWVPCKVIDEVEGFGGFSQTKTYKIKFTKLAKYPMFKTVYAKHMAYFDPPNVRLPIGSRVIAYFDATSLSRGKEKMLIPSAFYPGIIAEPLKQSNKFRYLVFYDDGYFQYVNHKDVRLVCQASENVWEDVHHQSREFIHNYLTQYAVNRPMVQTQKGQSMLVDYNGKWIYARVIDVDCSLVQMFFEGQSRSEWIYRGSTRLGPVYKESNNLSQKNTLNATRRRTEPFIRYINGDESGTSQQTQEADQSHSKPGGGEIRSVAKKSVSRVDNSNNNSSHSSTSQPVPTVRHLNNSTIFVDDDNKPKGKVVYYTARKNLPPRNYVPHICNPSCPFIITHNLSFYSPLAKPLLSGWERQVFRQKSKKFIVYRGPCGKRMRNIEELHRYLRVTDNELNVDNFDFSPDTNCLAEYVLEKCLVNKKDISCGKEKMPIPCVNYYDETMPPACEYSAVRIPTEGVPLNLDEEFLCGCDCEDDCSDKTKCACWQLTYAGAKYGMPAVPIEMVGYQYKRLYDHVPTGIYECNPRCKCKANCVNRVVQQPLQSKLQVFKTSNRGWGLRCINDVPRGSFICVYAGQMLTEQVANEGGLDAGDEYFAELDYIEVAEQIKEGYESDVQEPEEDEDFYNVERDDDDTDFRAPGEIFKEKEFNTRIRTRRGNKSSTDGEYDSQERQVISFEPNKTMDTSNEPNEKPTIRKLFGKDESCYVMDAKVRGNLGRYFNHSCSPNLFVQNVFVDTHDLRFPWVAFFASTHIRAGTELTWNYNYEVGVVPGKVLYCQCGAPNCRQRLL